MPIDELGGKGGLMVGWYKVIVGIRLLLAWVLLV